MLALAELYRDEGQPEREAEAARLYQQSFSAAAEKSLGPEHPGLVLALNGLLNCTRNRVSTRKANRCWTAPSPFTAIAAAPPPSARRSHPLRARLAWKQDRRQEALADLRQAMQLAEQQRARISGAERERAMAFAEFGEVFEQMVAWQVELGNPNEALEAMEPSCARSLLDELDHAGADLEAGVDLAPEREQAWTRRPSSAGRRDAATTPNPSQSGADGALVDRQAAQRPEGCLDQAQNRLVRARPRPPERQPCVSDLAHDWRRARRG